MSTSWAEGKLSFDFEPTWHAVKWDDNPAYRDGLGRVTGCKAVDFCGLRDGALYLIEVKDFRGHRIENKERLVEESSDSLADEVAHKVCDTVAGLVGAHRTRPGDETIWKPFGEALADLKIEIRVVLWLEEDGRRGPGRGMSLADRIKQKLRWLTTRVILANQSLGKAPPGLTVRNLAGAGRDEPS